MGGCGVPGATTSPHSLKPSNVPGKGCRNSPLVMGCLINREGSDKSPLGTVPTCPSREGVLDPARALGATSPPPGSSVQPEFWGMQGMRRDFCWPSCRRGLWSPAVGGCSLGMTLREGPLYPPPRHHTPAPLGALHPAAPRGSRGHGCTELCPASAPARHRHTARLRHTHMGQVTARAPTGPRQPAVPQGNGCQGSAGTPTPTAGAPRPGSLGFFPSLPSTFPSASNFSSSAKTNPQVSRAGAASGSVRPARWGGLLPASLLTPIQPRQSRRPRVPGADCCCLPARGGKASYIDPRCRHARRRRPACRCEGSHGGAGTGPPGSRRPARCRGIR